MAPPFLTLKSIGLTFGGDPILSAADMSVGEGERLALVGRNGSGKSTLLKIAAGLVESDDGERFVRPRVKVTYLEQSPDLSAFDTLESYLEHGNDEIAHHRLGYLTEQLGLDPTADPKQFSGGEQRRAALVRALISEPDVLLLDEPTNHLDLPAIEWLENELRALRSALVMISHDRRFLNALSRKTLWLDRGLTRELSHGFSKFEEWRDKVLEEEEVAHHKLARKIVDEEHWLRYGVTARRKRNVRRLKEMNSLKAQHRDRRGPEGNVKFTVTEGKDAGTIVLDAKAIAKSYSGRKIVNPLDLRLLRDDRLAIIGPNGAGKTTLISMLLGELEPDTGAVTLGANVQAAHLDQNRMAVSLETRLGDVLTGGGTDTLEVNGQMRHVTAYMKDFLFGPEQMRTPIKKLSGGERARLLLAKLLAQPSNLLVLDEPTNDLDLETLDLLEEIVAAYSGTVLLVSHDRDFIDRIATKTLMAEGNGDWTLYAGGYSDMLAARGSGVEAVKSAGKLSGPKTSRTKTPAPKSKPKLSFKQKHALETLPAKLDELAEKISNLGTELADPNLYVKKPDHFAKLTADLNQAMADQEAAESEWLELEILREELQG